MVRALALLAVLELWACRSEKLPELPRVVVEDAPAFRAVLEKALAPARANPWNAAASGHLGMVLHAYDRLDSAEPAYLRAHRLDPNSLRWIYYLAVVQQAQGKREEALKNLRSALRLNPDYVPALMRVGDLLMEGGDFDGAVRVYSDVVAKRAGQAAAHYGLGRARSASGDFEGAIEAWKRSVELYPNFASAHHALAGAYRRTGNPAEAELHESLYTQAGKGAPPREDPLEREVRALNHGAQDELRRGVELAEAGRFEEAAAAHERALQADPKLIRARINLISIYARMGRTDRAEEHYREAVAANPRDAEAHYNYGVMMVERDRLPEAKEAFRRALSANPKHPDSHDNLGYLLMQGGDRAAAERHFLAALEANPSHRLARFHLGQLLVARRAYPEAIEQFSRILQPEDDRTPGFTYALAATYARAGRRREALELARTARNKALERGQSDLIASIDRDIRVLERRR